MNQQELGVFQDIDAMLMQRLEADGHVGLQIMGLTLHGQPDLSAVTRHTSAVFSW